MVEEQITDQKSRSFAIMAVPFGLSTTFYITLTDGQSVTILWGWVLVSLISLSIAASLAEICAVYPTAGMIETLVYESAQMLIISQAASITGVPCFQHESGLP